MAFTRVTNFTAGVLPFEDLNSEFNNIGNYLNTRVLTNPLTANLDFADLYTISNLRTFWNIVNAGEFTTLAAALAAMPSTGGMLFIPPNTTFDLSSTVEILKDNTWIVGGGPSSILRRASGTFSESNDCMLLFNGRANCGIVNLQIDGQQLSNATGTGMAAVRVMGASQNFHFLNNYLRRWGGSSESATNTNDGVAIGADEASVPRGVKILGNTFEEVRRSAVRLTNGRQIAVLGNDVIQSAVASVAAGIHLETPVSGNARLQFVRVKGNSLVGVGSTFLERGIAVIAGPASSVDFRQVTIEGNSIDNTAGEAIYVEKGFLVSVLGNDISTALQSGATARGGISAINSHYVTIASNMLSAIASGVGATLGVGILVDISSGTNQGFVLVEGNTVRLVGHTGIAVDASSAGVTIPVVKIHNNQVSRYAQASASATSHGISVAVSGAASVITSVDIQGNTVTLDGTVPSPANVDGIFAQASASGVVTRLTILGNDLTDSDNGTGGEITISGITNFDSSHNQI